MKRRRPTRRDLLVVVARLQGLVGRAIAENGDRNPNQLAKVTMALERAHALCVAASAQDPPVRLSGPWAEGADADHRAVDKAI